MGEQAQRHKKIEDNPHYQHRERDQRGEDHDVWRIVGGIGHGVIRRAWSISVRGTSTTPAPKSIWFRSGNRASERIGALLWSPMALIKLTVLVEAAVWRLFGLGQSLEDPRRWS